jgi:hypothetical protein
MCDVGKMIRMNVAQLEATYQVQRAADRQEREAEKAAEAAAIEADKPLGVETAKFLVESMAVTNAHVKAFRRGSDHPINVTVARREKTKYYLAGNIIAKKDLIAQLAEFSCRTDIFTLETK